MGNKKIALIYDFKDSAWVSCRTITDNLRKAYGAIPSFDLFNFDYSNKKLIVDLQLIAKEIAEKKIDRVVILDHKPHAYKLLKELYQVQKTHGIEIVFHIYGDFTLQAKEWNKSESLLKAYKVHLVCASTNQQNLVQKFFKQQDIVSVCHFPVDTDFFKYSENLRAEYRKKLDLGDDCHAFLYTGRISFLKNVIKLIEAYTKFILLTKSNSKLYIAGCFDDIGVPFLGIRHGSGKIQSYLLALIENNNKMIGEKIFYIGNFEQKDLLGLYNMADTYVSLSCYNDEDYGMAPIEALCTGSKGILTDWGGYHDFYNEELCNLIQTVIGEAKIDFSAKETISAFLSAQKRPKNNREEAQSYYHQKFSISEAAKLISEIEINSKFEGLTPLMNDLEMAMSKKAPMLDLKRYRRNQSSLGGENFMVLKQQYSDLYKEIYNSYVTK